MILEGSKNGVKVTIVFLLYNGLSDHFKETLEKVLIQKIDGQIEIIAIDSGSSDGTVEFVQQRPEIKLVQIPNTEFGHGKTRQLGATLARGEFVVFLSQDAAPMGDLWLVNLVRNFEDPAVVGVCSRIRPRNDACLLKKIEVNYDLSARKTRIKAQVLDVEKFRRLSFLKKRARYYFFNNVSSAIRRDYLINNPIPDVEFGEDVEFAKMALLLGRKLVFEPESVVFHSHEYNFILTYKRNLMDSRYNNRYLDFKVAPTVSRLLLNLKNSIVRDIHELSKMKELSRIRRIKALLYSPIIHFAEQLGQYTGARDSSR